MCIVASRDCQNRVESRILGKDSRGEIIQPRVRSGEAMRCSEGLDTGGEGQVLGLAGERNSSLSLPLSLEWTISAKKVSPALLGQTHDSLAIFQ